MSPAACSCLTITSASDRASACRHSRRSRHTCRRRATARPTVRTHRCSATTARSSGGSSATRRAGLAADVAWASSPPSFTGVDEEEPSTTRRRRSSEMSDSSSDRSLISVDVASDDEPGASPSSAPPSTTRSKLPALPKNSSASDRCGDAPPEFSACSDRCVVGRAPLWRVAGRDSFDMSGSAVTLVGSSARDSASRSCSCCCCWCCCGPPVGARWPAAPSSRCHCGCPPAHRRTGRTSAARRVRACAQLHSATGPSHC
jgi:hypothetical protein